MNKISNKIGISVPHDSLKCDSSNNLQRENCGDALKQDYLGKIDISLHVMLKM